MPIARSYGDCLAIVLDARLLRSLVFAVKHRRTAAAIGDDREEQPWATDTLRRAKAGTGPVVAVTLVLAALSAVAHAQTLFRIGVVEDLSGVCSSDGSPNMVPATQTAVEDFGGKVLGRLVEVLSVNHQNKPDVSSTLARQLVD